MPRSRACTVSAKPMSAPGSAGSAAAYRTSWRSAIMEFERLEQAWRSQANTPDQQAQAYLMEQLMHALKARRRGEILLFAIPVAAMTVFTVIAGRSILAGRVDLDREWGALAMLGVCW